MVGKRLRSEPWDVHHAEQEGPEGEEEEDVVAAHTSSAGTPEPIVAKLRDAAKKVAVDPAVIATIGRAGSPIEYLDAPDFQRYWDADAALMTDAVKKIGKVE